MYNLCRKTFTENSDGGDHLVRHPTVPQQPPQNVSADTIKGLFEIYKVDTQGGLQLCALLLNDLRCCNLICTVLASSVAHLFLSKFSSSMILMCSSITLQNTLLAMVSSMMPRQFLRWLRSPFLGSLISRPFFHSSSIFCYTLSSMPAFSR